MPIDPETPQPFDNWNRRDILRQGLVGSLGLNLGSLIWARAALAESAARKTGAALEPGTASKPKPRGGQIRACILVFYYGGPSHLDTFDPKPHAPKEIRGEFSTISTSVPGLARQSRPTGGLGNRGVDTVAFGRCLEIAPESFTRGTIFP